MAHARGFFVVVKTVLKFPLWVKAGAVSRGLLAQGYLEGRNAAFLHKVQLGGKFQEVVSANPRKWEAQVQLGLFFGRFRGVKRITSAAHHVVDEGLVLI